MRPMRPIRPMQPLRPKGSRARRWIRGRWRDERGAVLVIAAVSMVAILGMCAFAIDVGSWYQVERQAQAAADAGALAGANDLPCATAGCATADAQAYVTSNISGATATITAPYNGSASEIEVTVTKVAPSFFGKLLGVNSATVSATAVAQTTQSTTCSDPGDGCYSIFAMDSSSCGSFLSPHYDLTLSGLGMTIYGAIHSNGSANSGLAVLSRFGPSTYSTASGCSWSPGLNTFASGPSAEAPISTWPANYTTDFPACGAGSAPCTGPGGTPSFCTAYSTAATWSVNPSSGNIYCGVGHGTASVPSTWTGALNVGTGLVGSSGTPLEASYVAGSVSLGSFGDYLEACGYSTSGYKASACSAAAPALDNYPLIYAVSGNINAGAGASMLVGDLFAPNGTISFYGALASVGFLEGYDVTYLGILTGDGPSSTGTSSSFQSLIQ